MTDKRKCTRCSVTLPIAVFTLKRNGDYTKQCNVCNEKQRNYNQKNKCEHNKLRSSCKECGGSQICEHERRRAQCKDCGGASICEHGRRKYRCKDCGGASICEHNKIRSCCKDCGGSQICEHNKLRSSCKECGGSQICVHGKQRGICKLCDPLSHLASIIRRRVNHSLKNNKLSSSIEYLGTTIQEYRSYIEEQFEEGMSWDNYGEWQIDHIIPLRYRDEEGNLPDLEELIERLHFSNTQPLWAEENNAKGNRYIG